MSAIQFIEEGYRENDLLLFRRKFYISASNHAETHEETITKDNLQFQPGQISGVSHDFVVI